MRVAPVSWSALHRGRPALAVFAALAAVGAVRAPPTSPGDSTDVVLPAQLLPESPAPARPVGAAWTTGARPEVVLRFVVDTTGRVEVPSVEVLDARDPTALAAVRAVLPGLRYLPARLVRTGYACVVYNGGPSSCGGSHPRVRRLRSREVLRVQF
jgi:hypothetical protein